MGVELTVPTYLRSHLDVIARRFEDAVTDQLVELRRLPHGAVIDHLPEFIDALASWIEAHVAKAEAAEPFLTLADGHAVTRLGFGVSLETLTQEYVILRNVILTELSDLPMEKDVRRDLIVLSLGMDNAVMEAVRRYTANRDELRERFIAILGHDLRNPLSAISMGAAALLESDQLGATQVKIAARIKRGVERMERMIADVLDFARGHLGGGIPAVPVHLDLGTICIAAVDEILAGNPERTIDVEATGDLTGFWDGDRVSQALGNLLANAVAHGADPITLRAWEAEDRRSVFTSVSSSGVPIPPEMQQRLFEPFRGHRRPGGGLGLGLYITQQIVLAHGGMISVESTSEATTFLIRWPRVPPAATPAR
jgi:signal transduction histidine kinase